MPADDAYAALEASATETDDEVLASVVQSALTLAKHDPLNEDRIVGLVQTAMNKGGASTRFAASRLFAHDTDAITERLLQVILPHLRSVKADHGQTIRNIDWGLSHLLKNGRQAIALQFLEEFLPARRNEISFNPFNSTALKIRTDKVLLNKTVTRWLLSGEPTLGEAARVLVTTHKAADVQPEFDITEMGPLTFEQVRYAARKAIGYLFFEPVLAAGMIVQLMSKTSEEKTLDELGELLFDPLLLNYSGKAADFIEEQLKTAQEPSLTYLKKSMTALKEYIEGLRSVGNLPDLHPGEAQRTTHWRQFSRQMSESMAKAEAQSPLLSMISKTTLLYGRSSIDYIEGPNGPHRMETPLKSHSMAVEMSRQSHLDPFTLDFTLRTFRSERRPA